MLALTFMNAQLCPCGCGQRREDVVDPEVEFVVHQSTCNARLALLEAERGAVEERGQANHPARMWRVEKR